MFTLVPITGELSAILKALTYGDDIPAGPYGPGVTNLIHNFDEADLLNQVDQANLDYCVVCRQIYPERWLYDFECHVECIDISQIKVISYDPAVHGPLNITIVE